MNITRARIIAVVRILIGIGFVWVGVSILLNHDLLFGGLMEHLTASGGPTRIYRRIVPFIERRETVLVYLSAVASISVGVFYACGLLTSLTSLAASAMVLNYALVSSSGNWMRFLTLTVAAVALLWLGRLGAGCTWGVDGWLIRYFNDWLVLFPLRRKAPRKLDGSTI